MLTNRTDFFVTAVTVCVLPDALPAAILRLRAIALTHPMFDPPSASYRTGCPWRPRSPATIN